MGKEKEADWVGRRGGGVHGGAFREWGIWLDEGVERG